MRGKTVTDRYQKGDVFWAPDPFKTGSNPRLWLVLSADPLPFPGEEYLCAALTTSSLPANHEIGDDWVTGRNPDKTSYCSPWVIGTVKHRAITSPQGNVTAAFTDRMIDRCAEFLRGP
ncbi:hypothetical protein [Halovenus halobia]|uniref:hypothetical protein n=1 Tax=Halovenus halobia TaxID=3396622 RepID=UPI003F569E97